jgi:uncharacterized protein
MSIQSLKIELSVPAKMRDGTILRADIYRPEDTEKYPAILLRTPYNKNLMARFHQYIFDPIRAVKNGYVVVIQDTRGRYDSEGDFIPFLWEKDDGYDSVEWVSMQSWSNSMVGMTGGSYLGVTQLAAASAQPPHLKAIFPMFAGTNKDLFRYGGAFNFQTLLIWSLVLVQDQIMKKALSPNEKKQAILKAGQLLDEIQENYWYLPLKDFPFFMEYDLCYFFKEILEHCEFDQYWDEKNVFEPDKINIPAYFVNGWYDIFPIHYQKLTKKKNNIKQQPNNNKLLIGPWAHSPYLHRMVGELDMGLFSQGDVIDLTGIQIRWFDHWLKGIDNGIMDEPPVRIFVMGEKTWRHENEWPLARTLYTKYFIHSGGGANNLAGDGRLSTNQPADQPPDIFKYNPMEPVPTKGGAVLDVFNSGPCDQREIENRNDVLVYTSDPLEDVLEVTGPITMRFYASSSTIDTDFTAKLVDVYPDGRAYNIQEGIVRARYRNGPLPECSELIEPGRVYEYNVDLGLTSNVFLPGHAIRIEISSSNFPKHDRNLNNGESYFDSINWNVAEQKIYHNQDYPSYIVLPVIPRI